jgi:ABC-type transport system involved in cytochrome bd biosynthesis fused ATPase/permease subunit
VDVRQVSQSDLREKIGYIPQRGILFTGSVESNLRFADQQANDETLLKPLDRQASEFVFANPEGLEAEISQGGSNVSGGQKQRLSIARALVKKPPIFIFDDSFSALDFKTDAALRLALKEKTGHSTVLMVTQRVATVKSADQIIVLDQGKIVGKGTHHQLDGNLPSLPGNCHITAQQGGTGMSDHQTNSQSQAKQPENQTRHPESGAAVPMAMMKGEKARDFKGTFKRLSNIWVNTTW